MTQHTNQPTLIQTSELNLETVIPLIDRPIEFQQKKTIGLYSVALSYSDMGFVVQHEISKVLEVLRNGLALGETMYNKYVQASGLDQDKAKMHHSEEIRAKYAQKRSTGTFIALFATVYYCQYFLSELADDTQEVPLEGKDGLIDQDYTTFMSSRKCMLMNIEHCLIQQSEKLKTDVAFRQTVFHFMNQLMDELLIKHESFEFTDFYTRDSYILEDTNFTLQGFETFLPSQIEQVSFNTVNWEDIVGNVGAKNAAQRQIDAMLCYNPETQTNVMKKLGAYTRTALGYGSPGTGKGLLISAQATELQQRCADMGKSFMFAPLPDNIVSTYQGGSAERMQQYMQTIMTPKHIVFAPIDDAENCFQDREADGVSAGVKEIIGVFLRFTEGAYAMDYGNLLINMYTNIPGVIDKAVLSRIQNRYEINGAVSFEDMMDQNNIGLISSFSDLLPGVMDISSPAEYEYMSAQRKSQLESFYETRANTDVAKVAEILEAVSGKYNPRQPEYFASLFAQVQNIFPHFTSREVRNIHSAVKSRLFDFDFPTEWRENPEVFYLKDEDVQEGLLVEVMREHMKGKSFSDIFMQESISHISNLAVISDAEFEKAVEKEVNRQKVFKEAQKRLPSPS